MCDKLIESNTKTGFRPKAVPADLDVTEETRYTWRECDPGNICAYQCKRVRAEVERLGIHSKEEWT